MFVKQLIAVLLICTTACALAGNITTRRDASGRTISTETTHGNITTRRDASGRTISTATKSGNTTTYRDASGKVIATERK